MKNINVTFIIILILYLLLGALSGQIASRIMHSESSMWRNTGLGIVGSIVGNAVFTLIGFKANGIIAGVIVSVAGACLCIWLSRRFSK